MKPIIFTGASTSNERKRELTNYYLKLFSDNMIDTEGSDLQITLDVYAGGYAPKNIKVECSNNELKREIINLINKQSILE